MKIVHVQASVQSSSNAPYRLHTAMLANGLDSYMLVMNTIKSNSINFHAIKHIAMRL